MEQITLRTISERAAASAATAVSVLVVKKNVIDIRVHVDGEVHEISFSVPLSSALMNSQKTRNGLIALLKETLKLKFGKAEVL